MLATLTDQAGAFDDFYRSEYGRALAVAYALSGDRGAAEDVVQEAFIAAHRSWDSIGGYEKPGAWVRRVIVNQSRSAYRRRGREAAALARVVAPDAAAAEEPSVDPDHFWAEVRTLPAQQARAVALRYVDDLEISEIALILECAESTVRVHLHRARQTLAARFSLEEDDE